MNDESHKHLLDAYAPAEIARRVLDVGVAKARLPVPDTLVLAVLAGAFIALGGVFATVAMTSTGLGFGPTRLIGGVAFSLGLILVVVAGAELFTGNNLVAMAWASRAVTTVQIARNWSLVYAGNFVGAAGTALLVYWSGIWLANDGAVGANAVQLAAAKSTMGFGEAFVRGVLCNALVCLAIWLCQSGRSTTDRILAIIWPIAAFVAIGFEHSVANMYFIPLGMLLGSDATLLAVRPELAGVVNDVTVGGLLSNLVPVTLGNIVGGTVLVASVYWFAFLRRAGTKDETGS